MFEGYFRVLDVPNQVVDTFRRLDPLINSQLLMVYQHRNSLRLSKLKGLIPKTRPLKPSAFCPFHLFLTHQKKAQKNQRVNKKSLKSSVLKALERLLLHHQQLISRLDSRLHGPSLALHATHQNLGRWWPQFQRQTQIFHLRQQGEGIQLRPKVASGLAQLAHLARREVSWLRSTTVGTLEIHLHLQVDGCT